MGIMDELLGNIDAQGTLSEEQRQSDVERCRYSLVEFVKTYLSDSGDELDELCSFHYDLASRLESVALSKNKSTESCIMSPRGHGKSFWTSYAFILWCIAYQHTKNILLVTNETSLGRQFIIDIRQFIEDSDKFIEDFGDLTGDVIWTSERLACSNGICVSTKGSGASLRGCKMFGVRPTAIICDDLLSLENSGNTEQRAKLYSWYTKVLIKCASKFCNTFIIGTPQNDSDLLSMMFTAEQFSDYYTKKYQAIISYSDSDLWDTWSTLRNDLSNPNRTKNADDFYFANKSEMLEGTKVLWDRYDDTYLVLMKEKQKLGSEAWSAEMMCEALDESTREFQESWIEKCYYELEDLPEIIAVHIGVDASATANRTSDDAAIVCVGVGSDNFLYVLDVFSKKINVDGLADQMLIFGVQYYSKISKINIEDVVFQILVKDIMERKALDSGLYLPFTGVKVRTQGNKQVKLRSLCVPIRNGYIKIRKDQRKLLEEMRRFPVSKSDNCLDALWIATYGLIGGGTSNFGFSSINTDYSKSNKASSWEPKWLQALKQRR